jgi:hypothetical protein
MSAIVVDRRPDGTLLVRSPHELGSYSPKTTAALDYYAHHASYRTWGYWRRLDQTRAAIDEEGFFKLGDNLRFQVERDNSPNWIPWASGKSSE